MEEEVEEVRIAVALALAGKEGLGRPGWKEEESKQSPTATDTLAHTRSE